MKRSEPSKRHAADCLRTLGYEVDEIPAATTERADLRVTRAGEEYLVEAKGRSESPKWLKFIEKLRETSFETLSREIEPWSGLSSMIKKAHSQLSKTPASAQALRLLWVPAVHQDDEFVLSCVFRQLYGVVQLTCIKRLSLDECPTTKDCYFYERGDFRRFRGLDGAVLAGRTTGALCVNPFSPRACLLRTSTLHSYFSENGAVRDPEVLIEMGKLSSSGMTSQGRPLEMLGRTSGSGTECSPRRCLSTPSTGECW